MDPTKLLCLALGVGFFGDLFAQAIVRSGRLGDWGLNGYFKQHGVLESAFIACGVVGGFYAVWIALGLPLRWELILTASLGVDLFWNWANVFPSLKSYYREPCIPRTILGVVIPFLLPLLLAKLLRI